MVFLESNHLWSPSAECCWDFCCGNYWYNHIQPICKGLMGEGIKSISLTFRINARKDISPPEIYEKPVVHTCSHSACTGPEQLKELSNQKLWETSYQLQSWNIEFISCLKQWKELMTGEGFVASAQKCNGVCLLMSFATQFIHFYLGDQSSECLCNLLLQGS